VIPQSRFTFRTHGGICAGERWLYHRDESIARRQNAVVEQPEKTYAISTRFSSQSGFAI